MLFAADPHTDAVLLAWGSLIVSVATAVAILVKRIWQAKTDADTVEAEIDDTTKDGLIKQYRITLKERDKDYREERKSWQAEIGQVQRTLDEVRREHQKCQTDQAALSTELRIVKAENQDIKAKLTALEDKVDRKGGAP